MSNVKIVAAAIGLALAVGMTPAHAEEEPVSYTDVDGKWFTDAVTHVSIDNDWLRPAGERFKPGRRVNRGEFASALVAAFAPEDLTDPELHFPDIADDDPLYAAANIAVTKGWIRPRSDGRFAAGGNVKKRDMDRGLVLAVGLKDAADGLRTLSTEDGTRFDLPPAFAYLVIADVLHLHYNHSSGTERQELYPHTTVRRRDLAYGLWKAKTVGWQVWEAQRFEDIVLPNMSDTRRDVMTFAFAYAGWPYVWAGEWYTATSSGYCCGTQKFGGYDCSGYMWWVLAEPSGSYDNTHIRPYQGWPLRERRASYMAERARRNKKGLDELRPGDGVFFDTDGSGGESPGWRHVDHGGIAMGNGWMIHSSGSRAGVTINWIGDGWWADHFVWGRRIARNN